VTALDVMKQAGAMIQERSGFPVDVVPDATTAPAGSARGTFHLGGPSRWNFRVESKAAWTEAELQLVSSRSEPEEDSPLLAVARSFGRDALARLRTAGVSHADLKGNIFLRGEGLYLWLPADRRLPARQPRGEQRINPFFKRASLVLRALLEDPRRAWGVRELAAEIAVSAGHVSEIARALADRGYARAPGGKWQLGDPVAALRDWAGRYDWRRNQVLSYAVPFEPGEVVPKVAAVLGGAGVHFAFTLLAGADLVAPNVQHGQTHLYVEESKLEDAAALLRDRMYAEPVASGGTLHLLRPYYGRAAFYGEREAGGLPVVSNVQLFLDLLRFPLRGAEAARAVALGPLAAQLGLIRHDASALASLAE